MNQIIDDDYKKWILEIKSKIRSAQMKAALSVNAALTGNFYKDLIVQQTVGQLSQQTVDQLHSRFSSQVGD